MSSLVSGGFFFYLHFFLFLLIFKPAKADLVINEFLPDPAGADGGKEFVELINTGPGPVNIQGLTFQFANGSVGPEWETRWVCSSEQWLQEGDRFLLVDRNWTGPVPFDAEVWLGLQNGPDAIRLVKNTEVLDLVGYGALTDGEMMEESPASLVVGLSISRKPDGRDTNNNGMDFTTGDPTPGAPNFKDYSLEVELMEMDPPSVSEAGEGVLLTVTLKNSGLLDVEPTTMVLNLQNTEGESFPVLETLFSGCSAGSSCQLFLAMVPPNVGRFSMILNFPDENGEQLLTVSLGMIQVGCGEIFLSEVLAAPSAHQGEWIEIQARHHRVNLENYKIRDEEGQWRSLPAAILESQQFLVISQDSTALVAWHIQNLDQGLILDCPADELNQVLRTLPGAWPSLNNSAPVGRSYADRIYLADDWGVVDHVTIPGDEISSDFKGSSWERMSHEWQSHLWSSWRTCVAPEGGTPGCVNSVARSGTISEILHVDPAVLDSSKGANLAHIQFLLGPEEVGWHVEIFDLWGGLIRDLGGGEYGPGPADLIWDGRNDTGQVVGQGGYVVLLLKSGDDGVFSPTAKKLVVVR